MKLEENRILLGCVADDFTGASDAASFLVEKGINTVLFNGIPNLDFELENSVKAIVIALKIRTSPVNEATIKALQAFDFLKQLGVRQIYFKYCSTFDSTKEGNIGPIIDRILEKYDIPYTILCPSMIANERIVKDGKLYVKGIPLNESHMKNHPLTPMWEADISKLMEPQAKYSSLKIDALTLEKSNDEIEKMIDEFALKHERFYIIPDYFLEEHGERIIELFGNLSFLTGGSGLMNHLGMSFLMEISNYSINIPLRGAAGKSIILAGSCSTATLEQIENYQMANQLSYKIHPKKLLSGEQDMDTIWSFIIENMDKDILIYSSDIPENIRQSQAFGKETIADLIEKTMAEISLRAVKLGIKKIIVAGGETSGAVTKALGFTSYKIGRSIAPGVPIMIPLENESMRLVLKSGNFGQADFFQRALNILEEW